MTPDKPNEAFPTEHVDLLADLVRLRAVIAEFTSRYRPSPLLPGDTAYTIRNPKDAVRLVQADAQTAEEERLWVLVLDSKNRVIDCIEQYRGTLNSSSVRVGELYREAIRRNAASIIIVHNHPSGDPTPSPEDVRVTAETHKAGQLLDVELLDHIIVGTSDDRYISLRERGLGFPAV